MSDTTSTTDATSTDETTDQADATKTTDTTTDTSGADALGDAGKKALDAMKAERKTAKDEAAAAKQELADYKAAVALKDKPAEEQALEAARAEARTEATTLANKRILRSELKALATGKLADPTDAALYIDLDDFTVNDDGETDTDALNEAIDTLLEKKPHLAAQKQNRFNGDADGGAKGKDSKPSQLSEADLDGMTTEEIVAAKAAGRLNVILGIKN